MSVEPQTLHALEVVLRDARNMGVIMALGRLSVMPRTQDELQTTIRDLEVVRSFIQERVPASLRDAATAVFTEHASSVRKQFSSVSST
ncbi:hypothetical protein QYG06_19880 [Xanthomonas euvesicatoria]|uniref:Uncharacterized protein n=2 Tax=Xanthomonas TaxID=338 RepID=A0AB73H260_9XANT|nr:MULTISPECIES: hypothetical protein [Xanthomonas]AOY69392.1 hypothetical protein BHE83_22710 [Xanthomonas euvesicatoria pv. vesicatoria str. 85-10]APO88645.1 hypothetical protein BJD11_00250 [Xanthomonas euvesicatoria]KHL60854.1 hypothetical protein XEU66b_14050 [Xanthomonas euvesicatoria]KLB37744.1 hypothetical protein XEUV206_22085 [Xanthomonas euvesicatoria]KLB44597.1 hypothetical protein XEUV259_19340 [Xanthomonas euvesicatoria]